MSSSNEGMLVVSLFAAVATIGGLLAWKLLDKPKPAARDDRRDDRRQPSSTGYDWAWTTGYPAYGPTAGPYETAYPVDYSQYTLSPQLYLPQ